VQLRLVPAVAVAIALAVAGCGSDPGRPAAAEPAPSSTPASTPAPSPAPPDHARPLAREPAALAEDLTTTSRILRREIRAWRRDADPGAGDAPPQVSGPAARVGRIQRVLASRPALARRTLARLHGRVGAEARDVIAARRALAILNRPRPGRKPPEVRRAAPEPAAVLWRHYREARARSGVSVTLLAAVNLVESDFGRIVNDSVAGAQGPMQFMPATWVSYGRGGDVHDPHDAILAAARFLAAAGGVRDEASALYRYNPSSLYVTAVERYARVMRRDPLAFYAFYAGGAPA
jgi:soluble lytic murein transglycosylase-like protein